MLRSGISFLFLAALASASAPSSHRLETGELAGAKFAIAHPAHWNRRLLLLARPERPPNRPLSVELHSEQLARQTLLDEGWMIAASSFRRNGVVLADAIDDIDALRAHIEEKYGLPERVLLEGEAMGGLIATLIAERDRAEPPRYDGAVAIGATLQLKEPDSSRGLSLQPKIPLLFLANQTELEAFRHYVEATSTTQERASPAVLFRISRDGHANVNQRERLLALRALNLWLDHGPGALPRPPPSERYFDATIAPATSPSQVRLHDDCRGFDARVTAISPNTGDLTLNAQPADFLAIELGKTARFQLAIRDQTHRATYLRAVTRDLKRGEWIAYANAEGFFILGRHREDAAATAQLKVGDPISIRRFDSAEQP